MYKYCITAFVAALVGVLGCLIEQVPKHPITDATHLALSKDGKVVGYISGGQLHKLGMWPGDVASIQATEPVAVVRVYRAPAKGKWKSYRTQLNAGLRRNGDAHVKQRKVDVYYFYDGGKNDGR
jgi:hypothetical protein